MKLKGILIKRLSVSESTKLILGGDKIGVGLLKLLWLQRLPEDNRDILACAESGALEVFANTASKIREVSRGARGQI